MNPFTITQNAIYVAVPVLYDDIDTSNITVEPCKNPEHGDIATNAALVLAKPLKQNPRQIATAITDELEIPMAEKIEIAGAGFINITFNNSYWRQYLTEILVAGEEYGLDKLVNGEKVNVEYASPNPTGPMHVGHARGTAFGDALANLLVAVGYDVTREYYVNDAGNQIDILAKSVYHRYQEYFGIDAGALPEGCYPADYVNDAAKAIAISDGDKWLNSNDWLNDFKLKSVEIMLDIIKEDLALFGVKHDVFTSEASLDTTLGMAALQDQELLYRGTLPPPKGKEVEDWQPEEMLLLKSKQFGDDEDRAVQRPDGSNTYICGDIAYQYDKIKRGFNNMIIVLGADHAGYVKRLKAVVKALSNNRAQIDVKLNQLVTLKQNGQPFKMSKRAGTFITMREIIELVGSDSLRFIMLTRRNDVPLEVDIALIKEQRRENPVFYVQYAHARICSVFRHADLMEISIDDIDPKEIDMQAINNPSEFSVIKLLADWPRQVKLAAFHHEPHRIAFYLISLAELFHSLWNEGNKNTELRFIHPDNPELTRTKLALLRAVQLTLVNGLHILGVNAVKEM